jgi:hypothetical protein
MAESGISPARVSEDQRKMQRMSDDERQGEHRDVAEALVRPEKRREQEDGREGGHDRKGDRPRSVQVGRPPRLKCMGSSRRETSLLFATTEAATSTAMQTIPTTYGSMTTCPLRVRVAT